jgi:hypothetical protein
MHRNSLLATNRAQPILVLRKRRRKHKEVEPKKGCELRAPAVRFELWNVSTFFRRLLTKEPYFLTSFAFIMSSYITWRPRKKSVCEKSDFIQPVLLENPFEINWESFVSCRPPLWSSGQSSWLQIRRPGFDSRHYQEKKSSGSGTGSTQPREYNWGAIW